MVFDLLVFILGAAVICLSFVAYSLLCMAAVSWLWCLTTGDYVAPMFVLSMGPVLGLALVVLVGALYERRPTQPEKRR